MCHNQYGDAISGRKMKLNQHTTVMSDHVSVDAIQHVFMMEEDYFLKRHYPLHILARHECVCVFRRFHSSVQRVVCMLSLGLLPGYSGGEEEGVAAGQ